MRQEDGSEAEGRQFQRDPEELELRAAERTLAIADMRHHTTRSNIQAALFDRAKSTPETVTEAIEWAKAQPTCTEPNSSDEDQHDNFEKQWDRRAVVMAAALPLGTTKHPTGPKCSHGRCRYYMPQRRKRIRKRGKQRNSIQHGGYRHSRACCALPRRPRRSYAR